MLGFKAWMAANNVKQKEIAGLLSLSQQSVNKKVNGKEDFTLPQIRAICERYDISADIFLSKPLK